MHGWLPIYPLSVEYIWVTIAAHKHTRTFQLWSPSSALHLPHSEIDIIAHISFPYYWKCWSDFLAGNWDCDNHSNFYEFDH